MTAGRLLLATGMTLYVLIAMRYEERDLIARFGTSYAL
jgi:protein-S-isoprenylcysteine O-methyltransferase Ste14